MTNYTTSTDGAPNRPTRRGLTASALNDCLLGWFVCRDIDGKYFEDNQSQQVIEAAFGWPAQAEAFINCFPAETRDQFYIVKFDDWLKGDKHD